jgi:DNA polymerase, archaea type
LLPDEADDASPISDEEDEIEEGVEPLFSTASAAPLTESRDYDSEHYARVLLHSYPERLRVVFEAEYFSQLFRLDAQQGLFDRPIEQIQLRWICCTSPTEGGDS